MADEVADEEAGGKEEDDDCGGELSPDEGKRVTLQGSEPKASCLVDCSAR